MRHVKAYTEISINPKTLEHLEKSLQYLEEIEEELNEIRKVYNDLLDLWDASNSAYDSLWNFLTDYKNYKEEVSDS